MPQAEERVSWLEAQRSKFKNQGKFKIQSSIDPVGSHFFLFEVPLILEL
jgi:very-short-patch-repair endonuclease